MRAKRKSCKERQLVDLINKRFKVFCNESYCMNCELDFDSEESCEIQYLKKLLGKDE